MVMKTKAGLFAAALSCAVLAASTDIAAFDARMAVARSVVTNGVRWIDGLDLPTEGRPFADTEKPYDRIAEIKLGIDAEGTVDGCHPNDLGMMSLAKAFGRAVSEALRR